MPGYSGTPLARKLGYKPGCRACVKNAPGNYLQLVAPLPANVAMSDRFRSGIDLVHFFTKRRQELSNKLPSLIASIRQDGMIWISWPKKASKVATDVTEDVIREIALPLGLVDVKVCAVDDTWAGLKLVIRKELRK